MTIIIRWTHNEPVQLRVDRVGDKKENLQCISCSSQSEASGNIPSTVSIKTQILFDTVAATRQPASQDGRLWAAEAPQTRPKASSPQSTVAALH